MPVNKLMIVAHPDDETLFGGGELIKHRGEYKVVALDYGNHLLIIIYQFLFQMIFGYHSI